MKIKRSAAFGGLVALSASLLVACGDAPDDDANNEANSDYLPCMVSDFGGFNDKSFNEISHDGLLDGAKKLGGEYKDVESNTADDYAPNIQGLVDEGCDMVIGVGFELSAPVVAAAKANSDLDFVLIDDAADADFDGKTDVDNVKPLLYNTAEAAFLAGYAAADYTKTGKVGTYGGRGFPTVTVFMDGFAQGVEYYNKEKGKDVKVVGWDRKKQDGSFTDGFEAGTKATNTARQILEQDVDVILPVGGPIYEGAVTAINEGDYDAVIIGTDSDLYNKDKKAAPLVFTSILKGMDLSTSQAIVAAGEGEFDATPYIGTLENEGVGIADFHDYSDKISDTLQKELDDLEAAIIAGDIKVESYLNQ
ncbi:BMP family lipoprotein [Nocardioides jishulii]|uniref:BMP family ABC transporter substrate-binding protein n=1 Tax=Nocardioides jishulii TaxID=2575440 RepID=A0A4V5TL37_9ACTN|nr:BMP family ABC transporter substrate-binding protein [Nocardioides jishulii]QCX28284.1 BMP family ABC transporter substrate-binding protein [Nocardioides jishulii]TKI64823.1 BMP family ABC transporter substrate-binding protein [Nocardioides jishulii]